jgi:serine/threonine protein kinase
MVSIPEIQKGTLIGDRYQIKKPLGQGGFGRTYLAKDTQNSDHLVVIKEFVPLVQANLTDKAIQLFQREAEVLAQLKHPQIPDFLDSFEIDEQLFLVQEYIEGKTYATLLAERQKKNQVFSETEIIEWLKDLLPVLDYIHSQRIIHRDISPDNIMSPKEGNKPVLIDFGVVKQVVTEISRVAPGSFVGKIGYSPPEQINMGKCYPNSDLYSLAITALVLLTGKPPEDLFDSYNDQWIWQDDLKLESNLTNIINKMIAKIPKDRYESAAEVLEILSPSITSPTIISLPPNNLTTQITEVPTIVKPSPVSPKSPNKKKIKGLVFASIGLISLLGGVTAIQSPHIPVLCKIIDHCARDKEFQSVYDQAMLLAEQGLSLGKNPTNIDDLNQSLAQLKNAFDQLDTIPDDVKIYAQSQQDLENLTQEYSGVEQRLEQENLAEKQLAELMSQKDLVQQETDQAKTVSQLTKVKEKWLNLQQEITKISPESFVREQLKGQTEEYQGKIATIDSKINQLVAEEKRRQEAARVARASRTTPTRTTQTTPTKTTQRQASSNTQAAPRTNPQPTRKTSPSKSTSPSNSKPPAGQPLWGEGSGGSSNSKPPAGAPLWGD